MVTKKCERCEKEIKVRQADINRGWGKFCSKSCKAKVQSSKTGVIGYYYSENRHPLDIDQ